MPLEGTTDFWLKQGTALRLLYEVAEPYLWATKFVRPIKDDQDAFTYRYQDTSKSADPKKKQPAHAMIGGDFPEIDLSRGKVGSGITEARGFQVRIKRSAIRNQPKGIDEINRAYKAAGFWLADYINTSIITAITAGATTPTWTPTAVWSDGSATPVDDLIRLEACMEREGYPYALTDVLVEKTNWYELKGYLTSVDISDAKQRGLYGVPVIGKDTIRVPVVDADVLKCKSGLTEGYVLGLDRNNPAAEYHYYVDNKFGTAQVQYETIIDGKRQMVTADNLGVQFETYEEQGTHDQILRFWVENKVAVTEPYAALYDNGI